MTLYLLMAALALAAGAWLTRPWWRRSHLSQVGRRAANIAAYKTRLVEIDAELTGGLIDPLAAAQLRQELDARLVADVPPAEAPIAPAAALSYRTAALAVLALAAFGAAAYWWQGSWRTHGMVESARADPEAGQAMSVDAMVKQLEGKLEKQPQDAQGWAMLGRSYSVLERPADSARAYARANELTGSQDPDLLVAEGEALALSRDRDLLGRPQQLFAQALKLMPDHAKALWYAGLSAAQAEDLSGAREHWTRLAQREDLPPELRAALDVRLQELAKLSGAPAAPATTPPAAEPALTDSGVSLRLKVQLAPALAGKPRPGQTLFVFAKAHQGPPMPLAVQRIENPGLPLELVLDDSMAMLPQMKLSAFQRYVVTARLGKGGDVRAQPGDWEGSIELGRNEAGKLLTVEIDRAIP